MPKDQQQQGKKPTPYQVRKGMKFHMKTPKFLQELRGQYAHEERTVDDKFSVDNGQEGKEVPEGVDDEPTIVDAESIPEDIMKKITANGRVRPRIIRQDDLKVSKEDVDDAYGGKLVFKKPLKLKSTSADSAPSHPQINDDDQIKSSSNKGIKYNIVEKKEAKEKKKEKRKMLSFVDEI